MSSFSAAFLVVATRLCIVLSSEASDVLQCTGERLSDGQFIFTMVYDVRADIHDCETQWLNDEKVAGISDADGSVSFMSPVTNITASAAVLQTCPENLECLLICPAGNIKEKQQCSCDSTPPTVLPEVLFPDWRIVVGFGVPVLCVLVTAPIVVYLKRRRSGYDRSRTGPA